jgi:hypothetical protein
MTRKLGLIAFAGLALTTAAQAQVNSFVLNDGLFRYAAGTTNGGASARTGIGANASANFGLIGTNTAATSSSVADDYLFQNWFWYRSAGDTREFALSNMTSHFQAGSNTIFTRYVEPIGGSGTANGTLTFDLTYTLNQITATSAAVTINWSITNNTQSSQTVNFFSYADSDMSFTSFSDDNGSYLSGSGVNTYRNDNSTTDTARFFTMSSDLRTNDLWNIGPFSSTTTSPRTFLTNTALNNFTNSDSAAGPADNAAGMQWQDLMIGAGATVGGRITLGYNYVIPTPGAAALLGLGALAAGRRRR